MGLFSKDWSQELDRAEGLLERGEAVAGLEIAERAERKATDELKLRAMTVAARARTELLASLLAKADAAEAAGDFEDAVQWLEAAMQREASEIRRSELEERARSLADRDLRETADWSEPDETRQWVVDGDEPLGSEAHYDALVEMLRDDVRALYEGRSEAFQRAVVDVHAGRSRDALPVLREAVALEPGDAVVRLEMGNALFSNANPQGAKEEYEAAWRQLGDDALDEAGALLLPSLWAQAALDAGEAADVVERLASLATPATGHPQLCWLFATALVADGRRARAREYLADVVALLPGDPDLTLLYAEVLAQEGEVDLARQGLERAIDASCGAGCSSPAPHVPTFLFLARLHLRDGGRPQRARELLAWVAKEQRGHLGPEEHAILEEYYRASEGSAAESDV